MKSFPSQPDQLQLPSGFSLLSAQLQGFALEGAWLRGLQHAQTVEIPTQGAEYDAIIDGQRFDVKLCNPRHTEYDSALDVFISHNEYLAGKEFNTTYTAYLAIDEVAYHLISFTFQEAKEAGAIQLFSDGNWAKCSRTNGTLQPPWSISLLMLDPSLRGVLDAAT